MLGSCVCGTKASSCIFDADLCRPEMCSPFTGRHLLRGHGGHGNHHHHHSASSSSSSSSASQSSKTATIVLSTIFGTLGLLLVVVYALVISYKCRQRRRQVAAAVYFTAALAVSAHKDWHLCLAKCNSVTHCRPNQQGMFAQSIVVVNMDSSA